MSIRRVIFWLFVVAFAWVLISRLDEIVTLVQTLRQGNLHWMLLGSGLQMLYFVLYTIVYQAAFTAVGVESPFANLLPLTFAAIFVNATTPAGGTAGVAVYLDDARQRGQSGTRTAVGTLLVLIADLGSFLIILAAGFVVLFSRHVLESYEIAVGTIMFVYVGAMALLFLLGVWRPTTLRRLLVGIEVGVNWLGRLLRRPAMLREDWSAYQVGQFEESAQLMAARPALLAGIIGIALTGHAVELTVLAAIFQAFAVPASLTVVIAGYAMTSLFKVVSPTPSGIGVVEGLVPLVYVSLGVPAAEATLITLAFRGLTFWIPFVVGFLLLRRLSMFAPKERSLARLGHVRVIAFLTAVVGLINIVRAVSPALADQATQLERFVPLVVTYGGSITAALSGVGLLLLSYGLIMRSRLAWLLTLVVLLVAAVGHLARDLDYVGAGVALLLAAYLFWQRTAFIDR